MSTAIHARCNLAIAEAESAGRGLARSRLILAATVLASSLDFVDGSVINVGLPAIGRSFEASAADLQWVLNAYLLPLSALLLLGGAAGDRFGRARLVIAGTAIFALASAACALAPDLPFLLIGRAVQGVGAAMVMPNSLAILGAAFSGPAKGQAIGIWAAAAAMAGAAGPVIGGGLIDTVGWRAIFVLNLPIAVGAIALVGRFVKDAPDERRARLDLAGAVLATSGLGALTWGLTIGAGPRGWSASALTALAAGGVLLMLFVGIERRRGARAMVPLALFGSRSFVGLTLLTLLLYGALGLLFVLVPYVLIRAIGYSGTAAGAALLPIPLVLAIASPTIGKFATVIGARIPLIVGPLVVAIGFLLAARLTPGGSYWTDLFPSILLIALGMACAVAPLTTAVISAVDKGHAGSASGINTAVAQTGGLIATALLGGVLAAHGAGLVANARIAFMIAAIAAVGASLSAVALVASAKPS
jgi:EmrB/QacA subfamily drug resistance transporter